MAHSLKISEKKLQEAAHFLFSEPSTIRITVSGKRLQILSPGRLNVHEGPDFLEIAVLLDGMVIVGDAEFHKKSSDWKLHNHSSDERYDSVILHVVLENDVMIQDKNFEVLLITAEEIEQAMMIKKTEKDSSEIISSIEELQHYSLLRLLRKTADAQKLIKNSGLNETLRIFTADFIKKYLGKRKRPVYKSNELLDIPDKIGETKVAGFFNELLNGETVHIPDIMQTLVKSRLLTEGSHFRRELLLNCILPISICLANEEARINLFLWYWSTPSLNKYGLLTRKFPGLPQNFLWQQQGMLEYIKEHGKKQNIISETIKSYGFAEVLSFYRLGRAPFAVGNEQD